MQSFDKRTGLILFTLLWSSSVLGAPETINIQGSLSDASGEPLVGTRAFQVQFYDSLTDGAALGLPIDGTVTVSAAGRFSIELSPAAEVFGATDVYYQLGVDSADPTDGVVSVEDLFPDRVKVHSVLFARTVVDQGPGSGLDADMLDGVDSAGFAGAAHPHNLQDLNGAVTDAQVPDDITVDHAASADIATMAGHATTADMADRATSAMTATTALGLSGPLSNPGDRIALGDNVFLQVAADGIVELLAGGRRLRLAGQKWFDPTSPLDNFSPDGQDGSDIKIALNSMGEALIAWRQSDGVDSQLFISEFRDGSWMDPADLNDNISPGGTDAEKPEIALNDSGEAVVVWEQADNIINGILQIFRSEYRNGSWTHPADLTDNFSPDGQAAEIPQVDMNNSGEAVIVWFQSDGANTQIFRSEYRSGSWTDPANLADNFSPNGQDAANPQVAMNNNGEALIVWSQSDGANDQIFRSEYRNSAWSDPTGITDNISPDGQEASSPHVALNDNGDAVIVWRQSNGTNSQVFRSEFRNNSWTDPADLMDNISPDGQETFSPRVAMNDNGEAVIVWRQSDGADNQIFRSEYRGGSWTDPSDLMDNISPDGEFARDPDVALNKSGGAVIVWQQFDGVSNQIYRSEYRDGAWTDPSDLGDSVSPNGQDAFNPRVDVNDNWDAVIVWTQSDGANDQMFRSEFRFGF